MRQTEYIIDVKNTGTFSIIRSSQVVRPSPILCHANVTAQHIRHTTYPVPSACAQINVTAEELARWRGERVRHLISPLQTVLDDSIGCAVWFAARGAGVLAGDAPRTYCSPARVSNWGGRHLV